MGNYYAGMKFIDGQITQDLVDWLNTTQHYLKDINEYDYKYEIVKVPELPIEIKKENLRELRKAECFSVINRGQLWYASLTEAQKAELSAWYRAWLNITETFVEPEMPAWLK